MHRTAKTRVAAPAPRRRQPAARAAARPVPHAPSPLVGEIMRLQSAAGNSAVSTLLSPPRRPVVPLQRRTERLDVQRDEGGAGGGGGGPAVQSEGVDITPYTLEQELPLESKVPGVPVALEKVAAKVSVKGKMKPNEEGGGDEGGAVKVGASGSLGPKADVGVKAELATLAQGHVDALTQKLKYDAKMESAVKGAPGEIKVGSALTASVQDQSFKGTPLENLKLEGEFSLFEVDWKAKTAKRPEVKVLAFSPKLSYETPVFEHTFASVGQKGSLTIASEVSLEFGPNWEEIIDWVLKEIGPEALADVGIPLAVAAAGTALVYYGMKDIQRREELYLRVKYGARGIIHAGSMYAAVMAGEDPVPMGKAETDAKAAAKADQGKVAGAKNIDEIVYCGIMEVPAYSDPMRDRTGAAYVDRALSSYQAEVDDAIDAWHSEHWLQTFFSGTYASDDKNQVMQIILQEQQTGGMDTAG
jgi:hypothetical protein